jgi:hypothetical protein
MEEKNTLESGHIISVNGAITRVPAQEGECAKGVADIIAYMLGLTAFDDEVSRFFAHVLSAVKIMNSPLVAAVALSYFCGVFLDENKDDLAHSVDTLVGKRDSNIDALIEYATSDAPRHVRAARAQKYLQEALDAEDYELAAAASIVYGAIAQKVVLDGYAFNTEHDEREIN